jgi:hypothetical protein
MLGDVTRTIETSMGPLVVSPLTQGEMKGLLIILADRNGGPWRFNQAVQWSVSKAHPELTLEKLEAGVDMEDMDALFTAVLAVSNMEMQIYNA